MPDEVTISIDGHDIRTQAGKMVLEAAIDAGIYIPYLCYHPGMKPFAACRMCVVAVEGGRGLPASCTLPVQDGMIVRTESPEVQELRRSVMEMLIAEHPNGCLTCHRVDICGPSDICLRHVSVNDRCVTCPKNERCEFKDTVRYLGMELESPLAYEYKQIPLEIGDPFYDRDYNLCITCGRCVRVCEEVRGDDAIGFTQRSGRALVGTSFGDSLLESGCEFCGACLDVCPVGALVEKDNKWEKARKVDYRSSSSPSSHVVSCYRLVTNFQETNRQQETHARRDERTVIPKSIYYIHIILYNLSHLTNSHHVVPSYIVYSIV